VGSLTSHNPIGLSRPVTEIALLSFLLYSITYRPTYLISAVLLLKLYFTPNYNNHMWLSTCYFSEPCRVLAIVREFPITGPSDISNTEDSMGRGRRWGVPLLPRFGQIKIARFDQAEVNQLLLSLGSVPFSLS
jgi:hypothetical protein